MKIIICDDDMHDALHLKLCIEELLLRINVSNYKIIICKNSDELIKNIQATDFLFLDMKIGETSGIEIGYLLREKGNTCHIIITTYFAKYAIDGYNIDAVRYFIKPIELDKFIFEMTPIFKKYMRKYLGFYDLKISPIKIYYKDILYFEYKERGTEIHFINGKIKKTTYTLKYWINELKDSYFSQSHKAYLVNLEYISGFSKNMIILFQDELIPLSRKYKNQFENSYNIYLNENI